MTIIPCPACEQPIIPAYRLTLGYHALILDATEQEGGYQVQAGGGAHPTRQTGHEPHRCPWNVGGVDIVIAQRGLELIAAPTEHARQRATHLLHSRFNGPAERHDSIVHTLETAGLYVHSWLKETAH